MVPHIATDSASKIIISSTVISPHITSNMTNSEMELLASSGNGAGGVCLLLEEQHLIHMDDEDVDALQASVVFGSQLIDQNSATPYSDATKVRVEQKMLYYDMYFWWGFEGGGAQVKEMRIYEGDELPSGSAG